MTETDLIKEMVCSNCKHWINGVCQQRPDTTGKNNFIQTKPDETCGFWEKRDIENDLRTVYELIQDRISFYIDMKDDNKKLISLWVIGTWFHNYFNTFPYLFFNAMRGSAKTRTLKLIAALENGGEILTSLTEAVMFRQNNPLGIDEFEGLGGKSKGDLRELLNSAYKKGAKVKRMRKVKTVVGETQEVQTFDPYRPIHLANIWGMEEVLGDRCLTVILEKSNMPNVTKLVEDYQNDDIIQIIKLKLNELSVVRCSVVTVENIYKEWNNYIKTQYNNNYTTTYTTLTTLNYTKLHLYELIDKSEISGRHLELFFPLFQIAEAIGEDVLIEAIRIAKEIVEERKVEELTESKDVMFLEFISKQENSKEYQHVKELTTLFRNFVHDDDNENQWLNSKWVGRALKRLQLVVKKRRVSDGIEVILNIEKAKSKMEIFK